MRRKKARRKVIESADVFPAEPRESAELPRRRRARSQRGRRPANPRMRRTAGTAHRDSRCRRTRTRRGSRRGSPRGPVTSCFIDVISQVTRNQRTLGGPNGESTSFRAASPHDTALRSERLELPFPGHVEVLPNRRGAEREIREEEERDDGKRASGRRCVSCEGNRERQERDDGRYERCKRAAQRRHARGRSALAS